MVRRRRFTGTQKDKTVLMDLVENLFDNVSFSAGVEINQNFTHEHDVEGWQVIPILKNVHGLKLNPLAVYFLHAPLPTELLKIVFNQLSWGPQQCLFRRTNRFWLFNVAFGNVRSKNLNIPIRQGRDAVA